MDLAARERAFRRRERSISRLGSSSQAFVSPLFFSVMMYLAVSFLLRQLSPLAGIGGWLELLSAIAVGALMYMLLIWLGNRELWNRLRLSVRQVLS